MTGPTSVTFDELHVRILGALVANGSAEYTKALTLDRYADSALMAELAGLSKGSL